MQDSNGLIGRRVVDIPSKEAGTIIATYLDYEYVKHDEQAFVVSVTWLVVRLDSGTVVDRMMKSINFVFDDPKPDASKEAEAMELLKRMFDRISVLSNQRSATPDQRMYAAAIHDDFIAEWEALQ